MGLVTSHPSTFFKRFEISMIFFIKLVMNTYKSKCQWLFNEL